jgi:hypothetical protein
MPFPATKLELEHALAEELLARAGSDGEPWADTAERLEAARQATENYRPDPAGRPWHVGHRTELPSSAPDADPGRDFFVVVRGEREGLIREIAGPGHQKSITVTRGDPVNEVYETPSPKKASAVKDALNELEEEAERGQGPEDASQ